VLPLSNTSAWLAASALLVAAVVVGSLLPGGPGTDLGHMDKLAHFLAYGVLATWFSGLVTRAWYWRVAVGLAALGLGLEVLQEMMARGRTGDPMDMAANLAGTAAGLALGLRCTGGWAPRIEAWLQRT